MPGYVAGEAKARLLASAGVVVQPSVIAGDGDSDGLPVALLEGIAAGCIPVASDASGAQDFIETGQQGYLIPSNDAPALARAIIAAMTLADAERQSMLDAGRQLIRGLTWPQVARKHLALLTAAVLARSKCAPSA
jgi:glycosyltransferase involved in cell wall biosynthesis